MSMLQLKSATQHTLKVCAISMIRNEADIITLVLNHAFHLFDEIMIADVLSTDGTSETIQSFAETWPHVEVYKCSTQERYQGAIMKALATRAVKQGADWVFFLDADEFINVNNKEELKSYLQSFPHDVMHMPWINLIPSQYGCFAAFDADREFFWSGRVSPFRKIAVSCVYLNAYPNFHVHEGNHHISRDLSAPPESENLGLTLLHLPVRSADRLKYKLFNGLRLLETKHNTVSGEGNHAGKILNLIAGGRVMPEYLNAVAAHYGVNEKEIESLNPRDFDWPTKSLPSYLFKSEPFEIVSRPLGETLMRDKEINWLRAGFAKGSAVAARIIGSELRMTSQPMTGAGTAFRGRYEPLPEVHPNLPAELDVNLLIQSISASFSRINVLRFSAWSKLIPALFAMVSALRPRRYVELGVHNGMSFFAACQIAEELNIPMQCVAVDSWIGDPHASFHSSDVFDQFRATIKELYPHQHWIQGFFSDALACFDPASIDLLHIDGYHTYDAVRDDFATWLPKMSQTGIVMFHDINVHERQFGVWRFWEELKEKYPTFSFFHCHGLGILYVGHAKNSIADLFRVFENNPSYRSLAQQYFELLGELAVDYRTVREDADSAKALLAEKDSKIIEFQSYVDHRDSQLSALRSSLEEKDAKLEEFHSYLAHRDSQLAEASLTEVREAKYLLAAFWREAFNQSNSVEQREADYKIIRNSTLFDVDYYLAVNRDVQESGVEPAWHFAFLGVDELRNPRRDFDMVQYLTANEDVFNRRMNPFVHYVMRSKS